MRGILPFGLVTLLSAITSMPGYALTATELQESVELALHGTVADWIDARDDIRLNAATTIVFYFNQKRLLLPASSKKYSSSSEFSYQVARDMKECLSQQATAVPGSAKFLAIKLSYPVMAVAMGCSITSPYSYMDLSKRRFRKLGIKSRPSRERFGEVMAAITTHPLVLEGL